MKSALTALLFVACVISAVAQSGTSSAPATTASSAAIKDPVTAALRIMLPGRQKNTLAGIDAMPADKFSYKPTPDQMSFGHLIVHIIETNNTVCSKVADLPAPKAEELKETDSKEKLAAAAKASFDFCSEALSKMDDSKLGENIEMFGHQMPRSLGALIMASAWADHYGSEAMYLRLNGILPPSAQPKK